MTEPAPPGGDAPRPTAGPDAPAPTPGTEPASPWAAPGTAPATSSAASGGRPDEGWTPSPAAGRPGYAAPSVTPPGEHDRPASAWPHGPYPPVRPADPGATPAQPTHHAGYPPPGSPGAHPGHPGSPGGWPYSGAPAPGGGWAAHGGAHPGGGWAATPPAGGPGPGHVPPPPREAPRPPKRVDAVPGTPFGVVHLDVPPVTSGLAIGSLVAGIASILISLLVLCFGIAGPDYGGAWAAGAFTVLGALAGIAAVVAGLLARRQIRRPAPPPAVRFKGHGLALSGLICGAVGLLISLLGLGLALVVQLT